VSPLKTLGELYDNLVNGNNSGSSSSSSSQAAAGLIVAMDFEDIGSEAPATEAEGACMVLSVGRMDRIDHFALLAACKLLLGANQYPYPRPHHPRRHTTSTQITEPCCPAGGCQGSPHPDDQLAVVPPSLRGLVASSLWDVVGAQGTAGDDSIGMKQQAGRRDQASFVVFNPSPRPCTRIESTAELTPLFCKQRQAQIEALEASLRDIDEELSILQGALHTGSSLRAVRLFVCTKSLVDQLID